MNKKYLVRLTAEERQQIEKLLRRGRAHARKLLYARILLKADADGPYRWTDERIALRFWMFPPPRWRESADATARRGLRWRSCQRNPAGQGGGCWTGEPRL